MQDNNFSNLWESVLHKNVHTSFEALTDADVVRINGNADAFLQVLQDRYSYTPDEAQTAMDTFLRRYSSFDNSQAGALAQGSSTFAHSDHTFSEVF